MEGFSYNNIFDTKGIEYLVIIVFLIAIIPFWTLINRRKELARQIRKSLSVISLSTLRLPAGLLFSRNHTWAHLEKSGTARVGIDDFLVHLTGDIKPGNLRSPGDTIRKGDLLASIGGNGKLLKIFSPISGTITGTNIHLYESPEVLNDDPYGQGWMYKIRPSEWISETSTCYLADEAVSWLRREIERVREFLSLSLAKYSHEDAVPVLQDGGELLDSPLSELPDEVWQDFQKTFLN